MDPRDITDVLPSIGHAPELAPAQCPLAHYPRLAGAWYRVNLYGSLALWTAFVLSGAGLLVLIDWALWKAR